MGDFKVRFGIDTYYDDPDYAFITLKIAGESDVSCEDRAGSDSDIEYARSLITYAVNQEITQISADKCPYKSLVSYSSRLRDAAAAELGSKGITLKSFSIMNIVPDEKSRTLIANKDKIKAMAAMSPEELAKKAEEARIAAQKYMDSLSPEERQRAEENARKEMEKRNAEMQAMIDQAKSISAGAAVGASLGAPANRFCTSCGTPAGGGRFCSNCGAPLG